MTTADHARANQQIVLLDEARARLAKVASVDEAKKIRDQAEAIRVYAKQQRIGLEAQNKAAEIKIRAERRAGELLSQIERKPGQRTDRTSRHDDARSGQGRQADATGNGFRETIKKASIPEPTARRWQEEASVPEPQFETMVATAKATEQELTSAATIALARQLKDEADPLPPPPAQVNFLRVLRKFHAALCLLADSSVSDYLRRCTAAERGSLQQELLKAKKVLEGLLK